MPHIFIDGCDTTKNIKRILVHVEINFGDEIKDRFKTMKLYDIKEELEHAIRKYFPEMDSGENDILSDAEYNEQMSNH